MPTCSPWDIVRVPFPYTSRPIRQLRPALVIAAPESRDSPLLLWVLMITSAANRRWPGDVPIAPLDGTSLPAPSIVRTAKLATIDADAADRIGQLPDPIRAAVTDRLRRTLFAILPPA